MLNLNNLIFVFLYFFFLFTLHCPHLYYLLLNSINSLFCLWKLLNSIIIFIFEFSHILSVFSCYHIHLLLLLILIKIYLAFLLRVIMLKKRFRWRVVEWRWRLKAIISFIGIMFRLRIRVISRREVLFRGIILIWIRILRLRLIGFLVKKVSLILLISVSHLPHLIKSRAWEVLWITM